MKSACRESPLQIIAHSVLPEKRHTVAFHTPVVIDYPFEFKGVPLHHHTEAPEKLEELSFTGFAQTLYVGFLRFDVDKKNSQFPKVRLRATIHSNNDAFSVMVVFDSVVGNGKSLD